MRRKKISQAEARRIKKENHQLKDQLRSITGRWGGTQDGVHIASWTPDDCTKAAISTALKLDFIPVVKYDGNGGFMIKAMRK